jgi:hypothetical protein
MTVMFCYGSLRGLVHSPCPQRAQCRGVKKYTNDFINFCGWGIPGVWAKYTKEMIYFFSEI